VGIVKEERIGGQRLILGDCMEVMPLLGRFDAVVTDPPYGINADKAAAKNKGKWGWVDYGESDWDSAPPPAAFVKQVFLMCDESVIWGGNYFTEHLPPRMRWLVWDKGQRDFSFADVELAWTSQDKAARAITYSRSAALKDGKRHPTQKPVAVMEWCLGFLPDARTILDPFMGSGTTLVACQRKGRMGTGIELDPEYFDIACRRVDEAARQPDLFIAPAPKPAQSALPLVAE
jgi:DNA modification methylase